GGVRGGSGALLAAGQVAREHAAAEEVGRLVVDGVLEVAIEEAVADAVGEGARESLDRAHFDHALELAPRHEAQRHRVHDAEQAVAADREAKELRVLAAAAVDELAARVQALER